MGPVAKWLVLILAAVLALTGCSRSASTCPSPERMRFDTASGHSSLLAEIADTDESRRQGLSGRPTLAADHGMAFLFGGTSTDWFWMKDTEIPLSIAFWGEDGRIQQTFDMDPCTSNSCHLYQPSEPYVGAVEAPQGFFREHGIRIGDRIELAEAGCA
jgi:uncharacterized membrane protein (UPF0127 family)